MKLGIFTSFGPHEKKYIKACEHLGIQYQLVDIISPEWLNLVRESNCNGFLCRPPSTFEEHLHLFRERLFYVNKIMGYPIYPGYDELSLYENKRMTHYWLEYHDFPRPDTKIFYRKTDFLDYLKTAELPLVLKTNTGASAKGVKIIKNRLQGRHIANMVFGFANPKLAFGYTPQKTGKYIPFPAIGTLRRHLLIVQKYYPVKWEWRLVKIDESYFGHKKLKEGEFASGTKLKGWERPPDELLFLTKRICETGNFYSMNVDFFETEDGEFLVNELHALFGHSTPHLMIVDGQPGRLIFKNGQFHFEAGDFNQFKSNILRIKHFLKLLKEKE